MECCRWGGECCRWIGVVGPRGWLKDGLRVVVDGGEWKMVAGIGEPLEHWREVERKSRAGKKVVGCYRTRGTG